MIWTAVTAMLVLALSGARAEELTSKEYAACMEKATSGAIAKQNCVADEMTRQERRVVMAFQSLTASLPKDRRNKLRLAQLRWNEFREAHCSFYDSGKIADAMRLTTNEFLRNYTAQRAAELESMKSR
jgi:uncharacterized protein YecT (DUF1311 family)